MSWGKIEVKYSFKFDRFYYERFFYGDFNFKNSYVNFEGNTVDDFNSIREKLVDECVLIGGFVGEVSRYHKKIKIKVLANDQIHIDDEIKFNFMNRYKKGLIAVSLFSDMFKLIESKLKKRGLVLSSYVEKET